MSYRIVSAVSIEQHNHKEKNLAHHAIHILSYPILILPTLQEISFHFPSRLTFTIHKWEGIVNNMEHLNI